MDGWIDVNDRMPDKGHEVLAYSPRYGRQVVQRMDEGQWDHSLGGISLDTLTEDNIITHWQPLPDVSPGMAIAAHRATYTPSLDELSLDEHHACR